MRPPKCACCLHANIVVDINLAEGHSRPLANFSVVQNEPSSHPTVESAISLARDGLIGKASRYQWHSSQQ